MKSSEQYVARLVEEARDDLKKLASLTAAVSHVPSLADEIEDTKHAIEVGLYSALNQLSIDLKQKLDAHKYGPSKLQQISWSISDLYDQTYG